MNKRIYYFIYLAIALLCGGLFSCVKDPAIPPIDNASGSFGISLTLEVQESETRSGTTQIADSNKSSAMDISMGSDVWNTQQTKASQPISATDAECKINKAYILQYENGLLIHSEGNIIPDEAGQVKYVELKTSTNYNLYVLANYGSAPFGVDGSSSPNPVPNTETAFQACESYTDLGATQPRADNLPMYGALFNQSTSTIPDMIVPMTRLVTKVIYNVTNSFTSTEDTNATWALTNCSIVGAPKRVRWFPSNTDGGEKRGIRPSNTEKSDFTSYTLDTELNGSCYILENLRGTNSAVNTPNKKEYKNVSAAFLNFKGEETKSDGSAIALDYHFYLGKDLLSDFNAERNKAYTLTATIKTRNFTDSRCKAGVTGLFIGKFAGWDNATKSYTQGLYIDKRGNNMNGPNDGASTDKSMLYFELGSYPGVEWYNDIYDGWNNTYNPANTSVMTAIWYCRGKNGNAAITPTQGEGWFVPSQNQLMAMWIVAPAYPGYKITNGKNGNEANSGLYGFADIYFSSTRFSEDIVWSNNFKPGGYTTPISFRQENIHVRCVLGSSD